LLYLKFPPDSFWDLTGNMSQKSNQYIEMYWCLSKLTKRYMVLGHIRWFWGSTIV
jgi:hypothetical protein